MPIVKNVSRTIVFRMKDSFGAAVAGTPTVQVSKDGGAFAGCSNSPAAVSGITGKWSIVLTATEMNADSVAVTASLTGAIDVDIDVYTEADYTTTLATNVGTTNSRVDAAISSVPGSVWTFSPRTVSSVNTVTGSVGSVTASVTVGTNSDKTGYSLSTASTGLIVSGIWNEPRSGHTTPSTFGYYLDSQISTISASGITDWTGSERQQIRDALGVDGTKSTSLGGVLQSLLTAALSVGAWTVLNPVQETGDFTVYLGYDYTNSVGRSLTWSSDTWTNLSSAISVSLVDRDENLVCSGSVITGGTSTQTVRIDLTQSQIALIGRGRHKLRLKAVIGSLDYLLLDMTGTVI